MSVTTTYPFDTPTDYVYNSSLVEITGGEAKLKLVDNPDQDFTEDFSDDTGFTYDSAKAEFVGGVCRQKSNNITENYTQTFSADTGFTYDNTKSEFSSGVCRQTDQRPVNATFGATYTNNINGNWGGGTLTGTAVGGASVSGGKLDLTGGTVKGVTYPSASKYITRQTGCIRLKYTPNYSGIPVGNRAIIGILQGGGEANEIFLYHNSSEGKIFLNSFNSALGIIFDGPVGFFLPTAGVEYEIEFNWNFTTGDSRLFINGTQLGSTITGTGTISSFALIKIGLNYNDSMAADGSFNDVLCFDAPVHTANYTSGYTLPEYIYIENVVTAPIHNYLYNIASLDVPAITETNTPHYVVNGYYWDGGAWSASSNTYATSMSSAQWVANIATFPAGQLSIGATVKTIFQSSNTQSSIDNIAFTINETTYLSSNVICPEMEYTGAGTLVSFDDFTTTESGTPRYTMQIARSGNYLYWSGSAWATSDGTYAQANDKATFLANISTLPVNGEIYGQFKIHFTDSNTQSNIGELTASLTAQIYSVTNPTVALAQNIRLESLSGFIESVTKAGDDNIKYILKKDSSYLYWSGSAWVASSGVYAQSNTVAEILTNCVAFTTTAIDFNLLIFLHSDSGQTTPSIQSMSVTYDFAGGDEDTYNLCDVYWYSRKPDGTVDTDPYTVQLNVQSHVRYKNNILINDFSKIVTADADGYCEVSLIDNVNMVEEGISQVFYNIEKGDVTIAKIYVPETDGELLWDIEI